MLKEYCSVCNFADDGFIGLEFKDGRPHITFPRGYHRSEKDEDVRRDILHLLAILEKFNDKKESADKRDTDDGSDISFPIHAYQYVIYDFLANGYYSDKDVEYRTSDRGKINWKRTIQKIKPVVDGENILYLNFVTKKSITKSDIITRIHEYCVYESFSKLGWLYLDSAYVPRKSGIKFNRKMFISVLNDALKNTFNTAKKKLFQSMLDIINQANEKAEFPDYTYGVSRFEYVWQNLIDHVMGEENKADYFPHSHWRIIDGNISVENSALEPDTIMLKGDKVFILDAKYYKFGIVSSAGFLPATSSVHKQITYGEYVATNMGVDGNDIYSAFIIPYDSQDKKYLDESGARTDDGLRFVSVGLGDWIKYGKDTENYKYVLGILMDTKYLMDTYSRHNLSEIDRMAEFIMSSLERFKEAEYGNSAGN